MKSNIFALGIFLLLFGCTQAKTPSLATLATNTSAATETNTATLAPTLTPTLTATPTPIAKESLQSALLSLDDLPSGWSVVPNTSPEEDKTTYDFLCKKGLTARSTTTVTIEFSKGSFGPFLGEGIAIYSPEDAPTTFQDIRDAAKNCTEWTEPDVSGQGAGTNVQLAEMSFTKYGEEWIAFMLTTPVPLLGMMQSDAIYIRKGPVILDVYYMAPALNF